MDAESNFTLESIPFLARNVVIRNDANGKLAFQISTDEMYFMTTPTYSIVNMLDGSNTVREILEHLKMRNKKFQTAVGRQKLFEFLAQLRQRKLIEVWV